MTGPTREQMLCTIEATYFERHDTTSPQSSLNVGDVGAITDAVMALLAEGQPTMRRPDWQCWPDLRFVIRPLPWTWLLRPRIYVDGVRWSNLTTFQWLFLTVELWGKQDDEHPWFPMVDASAEGTADSTQEPTGG